MTLSFEPDALIEEALRRSGQTDLPECDIELEGFRTLAEACQQQANFTIMGCRLAQAELLRSLTQRLLLEQIPLTADIEERDVVVITGLPRTGSTLLHHLMSLDAENATLPMWASLRPFPERDRPADTETRKAQANAEMKLIDRLSSRLRQIHPMQAEWPEECITLLQITGASEKFSIAFDVPLYAEWLRSTSMVEPYRVLRRVLDAILPTGRLILKAPSHLPNLATIASIWPNARFVWLHRDPVQAISSFCSLVRAVRTMFAATIDDHAIGTTWLETWATHWADAQSVRSQLAIIDIDSNQLTSAPRTCVNGVYRSLGWSTNTSLDEQWRTFVQQNPAYPHTYDAGSFGLSAVRIRDRFKAAGGAAMHDIVPA